LHSADLEEIEARLDDDRLEIENQLRKLDSVGEALAGVTFRLLSESNETRLFVQLVFDQQEEISAEALRQISNDIESSEVFLGLDITLSEFDLRLADLAILVSGHLIESQMRIWLLVAAVLYWPFQSLFPKWGLGTFLYQ